MAYRPSSELPERPRAEIETDAHIEGNLATEVSFIILDTLERIVQVRILIKFTATAAKQRQPYHNKNMVAFHRLNQVDKKQKEV